VSILRDQPNPKIAEEKERETAETKNHEDPRHDSSHAIAQSNEDRKRQQQVAG
jgi:hypothetical protein